MNINNLGLLNILGLIVNEGSANADFAIAKYILSNIDRLQAITVNELIDSSFVSRSSIRRFCRKLGYGNFSELQTSLTDIIFPSNIHLREFISIKEYRNNLTSGLTEMIADINSAVTDETIANLAKLLQNHEDIVFLSSNNTSSNLIKFQQELFYVKKIIRLITANFDLNSTQKNSNANTLIVVVSISGVFSSAVEETVKAMKGNKILITANRNEYLSRSYDQVVYMSNNDIEEDEIGLLGKYGITYLFDLISQSYIFEYH